MTKSSPRGAPADPLPAIAMALSIAGGVAVVVGVHPDQVGAIGALPLFVGFPL